MRIILIKLCAIADIESRTMDVYLLGFVKIVIILITAHLLIIFAYIEPKYLISDITTNKATIKLMKCIFDLAR